MWDERARRKGVLDPLDLFERRAGRLLLRAQLGELLAGHDDGWDTERVRGLLLSYATSVERPTGQPPADR